MKFLRQGGSLRTAVEASFVGYELKEGAMLSPGARNWKHDVSTLYVSWEGRNADLTLKALVKENFPEAYGISGVFRVEKG